ncbi:hypothetical protein RWV98_05895 [Agathobaculum sp. NTUH-O15-33]|uniref:hypothetical protein n=1 Tax=Agathobaculum sp. NTUH-O15-33 TaxID=3079302 RepID=UPI0029584F28|nr:hypothetical protein [Agathobaculum sp. NTUH-O15-33]WNX85800.1 hypothetical protein RWV98_05895 [Agathobaculum sp. NTUH-O15-33]
MNLQEIAQQLSSLTARFDSAEFWLMFICGLLAALIAVIVASCTVYLKGRVSKGIAEGTKEAKAIFDKSEEQEKLIKSLDTRLAAVESELSQYKTRQIVDGGYWYNAPMHSDSYGYMKYARLSCGIVLIYANITIPAALTNIAVLPEGFRPLRPVKKDLIGMESTTSVSTTLLFREDGYIYSSALQDNAHIEESLWFYQI